MELVNHTRYPAMLASTVYGEERVASSVVVRVTYDIRDSALVPAEAQPWLVSRVPWDSPGGPSGSDLLFYKGGVDIHLFGRAVAPGGKQVSEIDVEIRLGADFQRRVHVSGPRVWHRRLGALVPTPPRPFASVPLGLSHAYGGKDAWDGLEIPCAENPDGLGFYAMEESAVDRPLPCIEDPDHLVKSWDDRPDPAGLGICPPTSPLHAKKGVKLDAQGTATLVPTFFNMAFAPMIARSVQGGDRVLVTGVSERGPVHLTLPRHSFVVRLRFGAEQHELPLPIDQVGIEVDEQRAFIAYRAPFRYVIHALQGRSCELFDRGFAP